jgi:predicted nucleic acid-binding protein
VNNNYQRSFLIDTNILLYVFDDRDPAKRMRALEVVALLTSSRRGAVTTQVLSEFFVNVTRKLPSPLSPGAIHAVSDLARSMAVLPVTLEVVEAAMQATIRYSISYWDALIWATARLNRITIVLSEDQSPDQTIDEVRTLNPLAPDFDLTQLA